MNRNKKRSMKTGQSPTVGLRSQLCKDCKDMQPRLCEVDGERALFHRWADEDKALLKFNVFLRSEEREPYLRDFKENAVIPVGCSTEIIRKTYAIVELSGGTVRKVEPGKVRFIREETCTC